ncbi:DUF1883 domain-containing protein [uncultured Thiocystis sp.]|uniref:DUF1883 domain-containing protein n=1 Tax=uncultured Thiocystis sp. TaxID=1202134 RepID=UPI003436827E
MVFKCIHADLGYRQKGEIVDISLANGTNMRLMDSARSPRYRGGGNHRYYGGLAKRSPTKLATSNAAIWHVTVDAQGLRSRTRASVLILHYPLPALEETRLSAVCNAGSEAGK